MKKVLLVFLCFLFVCLNIQAQQFLGSEISSGITPVSIIKKYKDISHNILAQNKLRKVAVSNVDRNVINKYVNGAVRGENTFLYMNAYLLGILDKYVPAKEISKPLKMRLKYYADNLQSSISHYKLPQNMILYCGIDERHAAVIFPNSEMTVLKKNITDENLELLRKKLSGYTYTDKSFLKTSYDEYYTSRTKYVLEINAPKNLRTVLMENKSPDTQKQVVIAAGYKWKIIDLSREFDKDKNFHYYKIKLKLAL